MSRISNSDLRLDPAGACGRTPNVPPKTASSRRHLYVVFGLVAVVLAATTWTIRSEHRKQLAFWHEKLTRIADANQRGLGYWVEERDQDAELLASSRSTHQAVLGRPAERSRRPPVWQQQLYAELATVADTYSYAGGYVLDRWGTVRARSNRSPALPPEVANAALGESQQRKILTIPPPEGRAGYSKLAFIHPIRPLKGPAAHSEKPTVIGYVVLLTRPEAVTALMSADAGATATGETVLVVQEAGKPVFISPLRHWGQGQPVPVPPPGSLAALSLREKQAFFGDYRDYRSVQVLTATRFLPDLQWGMVTKVDRAEALAEFRRMLLSDIGLALARILAILTVGFAWGRRQRILKLQTELLAGKQAEQSLRQSEERFWVALQNSPVAVFNQDRDLRYTWVHNPQPPWSEQDYLGKTDEEVIGVADGSRLTALKRPVLETGVGARKKWSFIRRGEKQVYDIKIQPLRNETGGIVGITCASTDVSERKQREERLREYEKVVEGLQEMIVVVDRNYRYLIANRAFLSYRGFKKHQVIGRSVAEVLSKDIFEGVLKAKLDECLQGNTVIFEMKHTYPGLGERNLLVSYFPIDGPDGVDRIASVLQDITDRKRAEKALRDSERRYRLLFEHNPAGMFRSTLDGKLLEVNEAFARIFGYQSREEVVRVPAIQFHFNPAERAPLVAMLREQGSLTDHEICGRNRNGTTVWALADLAYVAGESGGPDVLEGTFIDMTARKYAEKALLHSEAQLRAFIENAPYGIFRNAGDHFLSANPALVQMLGYSNEAELLALNVAADVFHRTAECRDLLTIFAQQPYFGPIESRWKRRDGSLALMRLRGRVAIAENGDKTIEAIAEDITQQRALEEHLSQSDRLEALGRLASGVAHDFNNLLLGITLNLEDASKRAGPADTPLREGIEQALQTARTAAGVTRQLLVFGRKRAQQQQPVNLNEVIVRSQDLVNRLAGANIHVSMALGRNLGPVKADPVQVQQVILNLIANARDAMAEGGQITIRTGNIDLQRTPPDEYFATPPRRETTSYWKSATRAWESPGRLSPTYSSLSTQPKRKAVE
jgi:PAS domain S-box-containing protein